MRWRVGKFFRSKPAFSMGVPVPWFQQVFPFDALSVVEIGILEAASFEVCFQRLLNPPLPSPQLPLLLFPSDPSSFHIAYSFNPAQPIVFDSRLAFSLFGAGCSSLAQAVEALDGVDGIDVDGALFPLSLLFSRKGELNQSRKGVCGPCAMIQIWLTVFSFWTTLQSISGR